MQIPNTGQSLLKDTTQASAARVRYRVVAPTFVNGRFEKPERDDGSPNYVAAAPGLEGPALRLEPDTSLQTGDHPSSAEVQAAVERLAGKPGPSAPDPVAVQAELAAKLEASMTQARETFARERAELDAQITSARAALDTDRAQLAADRAAHEQRVAAFMTQQTAQTKPPDPPPDPITPAPEATTPAPGASPPTTTAPATKARK